MSPKPSRRERLLSREQERRKRHIWFEIPREEKRGKTPEQVQRMIDKRWKEKNKEKK